MQADKASSPQPAGAMKRWLSELGFAMLGALIPSVVTALWYGAVTEAPDGTRLEVALVWLGYWAVTFLAALPFTWLATLAYRDTKVRPLIKLIVVALAGVIGILILLGLREEAKPMYE